MVLRINRFWSWFDATLLREINFNGNLTDDTQPITTKNEQKNGHRSTLKKG